MKNIARVIGALFLISTCTYMIGSGMIDPVLNRTDFLSNLYVEQIKVVIGAFLQLINAVAVVGIAIYLYPILKRHNEGFSLAYLASRMIESILLIVSASAPLILIVLSEQLNSVNYTESSYYFTIGDVLIETYSLYFQLAMIVLSLGSLLLCIVLYRTKLIPRLLSVIGVIGYVALLLSSCLAILGIDIGSVLFIPGAIFEIAFPVWLIIKGFNFNVTTRD